MAQEAPRGRRQRGRARWASGFGLRKHHIVHSAEMFSGMQKQDQRGHTGRGLQDLEVRLRHRPGVQGLEERSSALMTKGRGDLQVGGSRQA